MVGRTGTSWVELTLDLKKNLSLDDMAVLVSDGDTEVWLPLSTIKPSSIDDVFQADEGDSITIEVKEWMAETKGLI